MNALDLYILEIGPVGRLKAKTMRKIVEFESHGIIEVALELNAANGHGHGHPPFALHP